MPQARLPDINTAFIRYRSEVLVGMKKGDWDSMHGSLNGINGLLPQEYQVKISDAKYYELVKEDIEYECNSCKNNDGTPSNIPKEQIEGFTLYPDSVQLLLGAVGKVWICPKCNKVQRLKDTNVVITKLENPYFLGVVPEPPNKKQGLMDKLTFEKKVGSGGGQMLNELEHIMALFRDDNWTRGEELEDFSDIDTSAEEGS